MIYIEIWIVVLSCFSYITFALALQMAVYDLQICYYKIGYSLHTEHVGH